MLEIKKYIHHDLHEILNREQRMKLQHHSQVVECSSNITLTASAATLVVAQSPVFWLEPQDDRMKVKIDRQTKKKQFDQLKHFLKETPSVRVTNNRSLTQITEMCIISQVLQSNKTSINWFKGIIIFRLLRETLFFLRKHHKLEFLWQTEFCSLYCTLYFAQ